MEHVTWKSPGPMCDWVARILRPNSCILARVFLIQSASVIRLVCRCASLDQEDTDMRESSRDVPTDIETLSLADILQLCRVRSFYITDCTDWVNLFNTVSAVVSLQWFRPSHRWSSVLNPVTNSFYMKFYMKFVMYSLYCSAE